MAAGSLEVGLSPLPLRFTYSLLIYFWEDTRLLKKESSLLGTKPWLCVEREEEWGGGCRGEEPHTGRQRKQAPTAIWHSLLCQRHEPSEWQRHTELGQKELVPRAEAVRDTRLRARGWEGPLQIHAFGLSLPQQGNHPASARLFPATGGLLTRKVSVLFLQAVLTL